MRNLIVVCLSCVSFSSVAYDCKHSRDIERVINASDLERLEVVAGAGSLRISGKESLREIKLTARLCAEDNDDLKEMDVLSKVRGDSGTIETDIPTNSGWGAGSYNSIDLVIELPSTVKLDVTDSSGRALIENVAEVDMEDSSGALRIKNIRGDVEVEDSSGALELEDILGDVTVSDSSGAIRASDIGKTLRIESDSSGEIDAKRVAQDFIVERDSSGSISADGIGGDFVVQRDGSGGIYYENVTGEVDIPARKQKY